MSTDTFINKSKDNTCVLEDSKINIESTLTLQPHRFFSSSTRVLVHVLWNKKVACTFIMLIKQYRSQKFLNVTHIKERLLGQVVILFNCLPF